MWVTINDFINKAIIYHKLRLRLEQPAYTQYKFLIVLFPVIPFHSGLKISIEHEQHSIQKKSHLPTCKTKVRLPQASLGYITKPYLVTWPCHNKIK